VRETCARYARGEGDLGRKFVRTREAKTLSRKEQKCVRLRTQKKIVPPHRTPALMKREKGGKTGGSQLGGVDRKKKRSSKDRKGGRIAKMSGERVGTLASLVVRGAVGHHFIKNIS